MMLFVTLAGLFIIIAAPVAIGIYIGLAYLARASGCDDREMLRDYRNVHRWPVAYWYDRGWAAASPEKRAERVARNKKRSGF